MQEGGDGPFFIETVLGGKGEDVDAAKLMIRCLADRSLNGGSGIGIGRLPQHAEKSLGLAHGRVSLTDARVEVSTRSYCGKARRREGAPRIHHNELILNPTACARAVASL